MSLPSSNLGLKFRFFYDAFYCIFIFRLNL
nr:MAG TPA: hypothetical protein [Caudoviricetes sp.]